MHVDGSRQATSKTVALCKPNLHMHVHHLINIAALYTSTETGFTGSGFTVVSWKLHAAHRICALHSWTGSFALSRSTVTQHSSQHGSGSRQCRGKVVCGFGSPIHIGSESNSLCEEPHYDYLLTWLWLSISDCLYHLPAMQSLFLNGLSSNSCLWARSSPTSFMFGLII